MVVVMAGNVAALSELVGKLSRAVQIIGKING
jgi:hypothetical protein